MDSRSVATNTATADPTKAVMARYIDAVATDAVETANALVTRESKDANTKVLSHELRTAAQDLRVSTYLRPQRRRQAELVDQLKAVVQQEVQTSELHQVLQLSMVDKRAHILGKRQRHGEDAEDYDEEDTEANQLVCVWDAEADLCRSVAKRKLCMNSLLAVQQLLAEAHEFAHLDLQKLQKTMQLPSDQVFDLYAAVEKEFFARQQSGRSGVAATAVFQMCGINGWFAFNDLRNMVEGALRQHFTVDEESDESESEESDKEESESDELGSDDSSADKSKDNKDSDKSKDNEVGVRRAQQYTQQEKVKAAHCYALWFVKGVLSSGVAQPVTWKTMSTQDVGLRWMYDNVPAAFEVPSGPLRALKSVFKMQVCKNPSSAGALHVYNEFLKHLTPKETGAPKEVEDLLVLLLTLPVA